MKRFRMFSFVSIVLVVFIIGSFGCSHKKPKTEEELPLSSAISEPELGSSDQSKAFGLQTIHFNFDSGLLDPDSKSALAKNAEILKSHPSVKVQIEGYCDNRGGIQYNLALGEKRAGSAKKYLVDLGVAEERLSTVSFGKERPLDPADTEEAYAKNRRANFVLTAR